MPDAEQAISTASSWNRRAQGVPALAILILLSLLLYFHCLGSLSFFDADEPAFAEAAREMLLSGDWVTPHFNFQPRFDKPILIYWLIALAYSVFGIGEFSARFWSAAFGTGLVVSIYLFGRRVLGHRGALIAALAFATNVCTAILARAAVTDMILTFFVAWSLFGFFSAFHASPQHRQRLRVVAYLAMALAVLTKGPIGLLIPLLVIGLFVIIRGKIGVSLSRLRPVTGLLLFAAVALPWYVLVLRANGWEFIDGFFVKHHLARYTGVISGHRGPFYYFLPVVAIGFFPWSGMLPKAFEGLWSARARLRGDLTLPEEFALFGWLWFGVVFVFFSFSGTKLPSYIVPGFPALALLAGAAGEALLDGKRNGGKGGKSFDWVVGGLGCGLAVGLYLVPFIIGNIRLRMGPKIPLFDFGLAPYLLATIFALGPSLAVWARRRGRGGLTLAALATTMVLAIQVAVHLVAPVIEEGLQRPLREFSEVARQRLGPADLLVAYDLRAPSLVFYSRRRVMTVGRGDEVRVRALAASAGRLLIIAKATAETRLKEVPEIFPLDRRGGYVLYSNAPPTQLP